MKRGTAVAADLGFDLHQFFAWAKAHTAAERKAKHRLPIGPDKPLGTTGEGIATSRGSEAPRALLPRFTLSRAVGRLVWFM